MTELLHRDVRNYILKRNRHQAIILEIGANDGEDTKQLLITNRRATVHCFECDPRAIEKWKANIHSERAILYETALADTTGTREFHQSGGKAPGTQWASYGPWDKSGSLLPFDRHKENAPWMEFPGAITVPTITLDEWADAHLAPHDMIDFCWVDVQGAEALVLKGAQRTIGSVRYWYCECDSRPNYKGQATREQLEALLPNFRVVETFRYNILFENTSCRKRTLVPFSVAPKQIIPPLLPPIQIIAKPIPQPGVFVRMMGQLGNQMFQYCAGKIIADKTGLPYTPPKQFVDKAGNPVKWSGSPLFTMSESPATRPPQSDRSLNLQAMHWVNLDAMRGHARIDLECYFQRYELLRDYKEKIRDDWLRIQRPFLKTDPDAVYIHVRLTDYIASPSNPLRPGHVGIVASMDEYAECLKEFPDAKRLVIATDAPKDPFLDKFKRFGLPVEISGRKWDDDFLLLASADNMIMSQSTYSWWAGFLGQCKRIACPVFPTSFYHNGLLSREFPNLYVDDEPGRWIWVGTNSDNYPIFKRGASLTPAEVKTVCSTENPTFLEIGANEGDTTVQFLKAFREGRFYCCECDPRAIAKFHKNIADQRVSFVHCAIDSDPGTKTFYQSGGGPGGQWDKSGSLCKPTGHLSRSPEITFKQTTSVMCLTLDQWADLVMPPNTSVIDFLWIDVQGAELRVFQSGPKTLAKTRWVYAECHESELYEGQPTEADLRKFFAGWTCLGRYGDDLLFRNDSIEHSVPLLNT